MVVAETGSTNADLVARLRAGDALPEGQWLRAERQRGGRGREGRVWESPVGNLYASMVVHLQANDAPAHTLSLVAGLAACDMLRGQLSRGRQAVLKWPNDVLVDGAKIAGMLLEREGRAVVMGFGINIAVAPQVPDRTTISIQDANGAVGDGPAEILAALDTALARWLAIWRGEGLAAIIGHWLDYAHPVGTRLSVRPGPGLALAGRFHGLTPDGALILDLDDGTQRIIHSGDVGIL